MKQSVIQNYTEPRLNYNSGQIFKISKWRKLILERDKNQCQNCFNVIKDGFIKKQFSNEVHHIVPRRHGGRNTLSNGITLCKFCHQYFDHMYLKFGLDYFELIKKNRLEEVKSLAKKRHKKQLLRIIYQIISKV